MRWASWCALHLGCAVLGQFGISGSAFRLLVQDGLSAWIQRVSDSPKSPKSPSPNRSPECDTLNPAFGDVGIEDQRVLRLGRVRAEDYVIFRRIVILLV